MFLDFKLRGVVCNDNVSEEIKAAETEWSWVDDVYRALEWRLAHRPETGTRIDGYYILTSQTLMFEDIRGLPRIVVRYTFDDEKVVIDNIRIMSHEHD